MGLIKHFRGDQRFWGDQCLKFLIPVCTFDHLPSTMTHVITRQAVWNISPDLLHRPTHNSFRVSCWKSSEYYTSLFIYTKVTNSWVSQEPGPNYSSVLSFLLLKYKTVFSLLTPKCLLEKKKNSIKAVVSVIFQPGVYEMYLKCQEINLSWRVSSQQSAVNYLSPDIRSS